MSGEMRSGLSKPEELTSKCSSGERTIFLYHPRQVERSPDPGWPYPAQFQKPIQESQCMFL